MTCIDSPRGVPSAQHVLRDGDALRSVQVCAGLLGYRGHDGFLQELRVVLVLSSSRPPAGDDAVGPSRERGLREADGQHVGGVVGESAEVEHGDVESLFSRDVVWVNDDVVDVDMLFVGLLCEKVVLPWIQRWIKYMSKTRNNHRLN